jgi:iron complex outermembrane receptor protein
MTNPFRLTALALAIAATLAPGITLAQQAATDNADPEKLDRVTITGNGRGQSRQVQAVNNEELSQLAPGSSPLAAVARLPSVNYQSADAFGAYEWAVRITVRGFNQNQLGFTLDDIPLGDMSYGNFNGLHISRAIITENISRTVLSSGTGSLSTASSSNLGGTLQFYSSDPSSKFGAQAAQSVGSDSARRTYVKLQSGDTGFGAFALSVADQSSDKWKGDGTRKQQQLNLKWVLKTGDSKVSAFVNTSRRREVDDQDLSLDLVNRFGYTLDNTYPDFNKAVQISNTLCGNGGSTYVSDCDNQYYAGSGLRNDDLYGASFDTRLGNDGNWKTTVYHHKNHGAGLWYTPYVPSPTGVPVSIRTTEYDIDRSGILSNVSYAFGMHTIKAGFWYEDNSFNQARRFYSISASNVPSPTNFPSDPFFTQWQYAFKTKTTQFTLEDVIAVSNDINVNVGFKSLQSKIGATVQVGDPAANPAGSITAKKGFLPQVGITWALSPRDELFAGYSQNMRAYQGSRTGLSPFSTTLAGFNAIAGTLKPETSTTIEGGWRLNTRDYEAVVAAYYVDFKDRLLAIQQGSGIQGNPSVLANVGKARLTGLELALSAKIDKNWAWYNGLSLSKSEYKSDYSSNGVLYPTNGKSIVDSPDMMFKSVLTFDQGPVSANLGLDYMSKRYYTYLNDGAVPARTLLNAGAKYRFGELGPVKDASIQLAVTNLANTRYISTVGSNGFTASDPTGQFQTLLAGAPRSWYLTLSGKL